MYTHSIVLLFSVVIASALICDNRTTSSTNYVAFTVNLSLGRNASPCNEDDEVAFRNVINSTLANLSVSKSGGPTKELKGDICNHNDTLHRNLLLMSSYVWEGRATCRSCSPGTKFRKARRLESNEVSQMAAFSLKNDINNAFVNDTGSCLYRDDDFEVVVTITEISKAFTNPCP